MIHKDIFKWENVNVLKISRFTIVKTNRRSLKQSKIKHGKVLFGVFPFFNRNVGEFLISQSIHGLLRRILRMFDSKTIWHSI